jgi:CPA1 family monovalent cation:H+ antiporter
MWWRNNFKILYSDIEANTYAELIQNPSRLNENLVPLLVEVKEEKEMV